MTCYWLRSPRFMSSLYPTLRLKKASMFSMIISTSPELFLAHLLVPSLYQFWRLPLS
nr:hypothetical protein Iba_chr09bCG1330 [Ipomoea batatas]